MTPPRAERRIALLPPFAGRAPIEVTELTGGLTNESYLVAVAGERYVVRFAGPGTERSIDRRNERTNHTIAAGMGIAPALVYARNDALVTRYVEGARPLGPEAFREPAVLDAAVDLLARLHRSERAFSGRRDLAETLDAYLAIAADGPADLGEVGRLRAAALARCAAGGEGLCPCHVDPAPANFLRVRGDEPRLVLIDWEYSSMCEPVWDLADLSLEAGFDDAQDAAMLRRYHGAGATDAERARLDSYKGALALLAAAWAAARLADERHGERANALARTLAERAGRAKALLQGG